MGDKNIEDIEKEFNEEVGPMIEVGEGGCGKVVHSLLAIDQRYLFTLSTYAVPQYLKWLLR